jgi:leucyl aminopeptidase
MQIGFVLRRGAPALQGASSASAWAVPVYEGDVLTATAAETDEALGGALSRAVAASRFKGAKGQTLEMIAPAGLDLGRLLAFGLGEPDKLDDLAIEPWIWAA